MEHDWQPRATLKALEQRAASLARVRAFFGERGYLEVETPLLARAGATDAQLAQFVTHDHDGPLFLQTSPEYAMKRLLCAGSGSIFQITKAFRLEESGRSHNPEFTLIEWYAVGYDRDRLIAEVCTLIASLVPGLARDARIVRYEDLMREALGCDPMGDSLPVLQGRVRALLPSAEALAFEDRDQILDLVMGTVVAPRFAADRLTVVVDYPESQAALARINERGFADRFEVYCGAVELANGFQEAADADEYRRRFARERQKRAQRGLPAIPEDARLLAALTEKSLPPCAGVALGFDRALMLALGEHDIAATLAFPWERA